MKSLKKITIPTVLFFAIVLNLSPAFAKTNIVNPILKKYKLDSSDLSLEITNGREVVEAVNPKDLKIPASVTKMLTTYAVLKRFPVGFKFKTQLFYDGENLYIKGGGDPSFVSEKMWFLVNEFTRNQINIIPKDIIVDDTLFDEVRYDSSRESVRVDRAYDSPVGAMSFNWNSVNIFVRPGEPGKTALVFVDPESDIYELTNLTKTVSGQPKKELQVSISNKDKKITVSGDVAKDAPEKAIFKSVSDPDVWTGHQLKSFLKQRGITVNGRVRRGAVPVSARLVGTSESKSLSEILGDMNKFSNNYVAEMLTKGIVAQDKKEGVSLKQGVDAIEAELKKLGLTSKDFLVENPSGFSRANRLSAFALNKVMLEMKNHFPVYSTVLESLPIAGIDGTLRRRMKDSPAEGWVRAKTGYLDGVTTLSGYAGHKSGEVYTFTFLYNGPRDEALVREAFDQILISLLK